MIRAGAAPGLSGLRNSHIRSMAATPGGATTLLAWRQLVATGGLDTREVAVWHGACVVALRKDAAGEKARPIGLTEAAELVEGALADALGPKALRILLPHQAGVRLPAGAEGLARALRAASVCMPHWAVVQLDASNAFGAAGREATLACLRRTCLALAPHCSAAWSLGRTVAWLRAHGHGAGPVAREPHQLAGVRPPRRRADERSPPGRPVPDGRTSGGGRRAPDSGKQGRDGGHRVRHAQGSSLGAGRRKWHHGTRLTCPAVFILSCTQVLFRHSWPWAWPPRTGCPWDWARGRWAANPCGSGPHVSAGSQRP